MPLSESYSRGSQRAWIVLSPISVHTAHRCRPSLLSSVGNIDCPRLLFFGTSAIHTIYPHGVRRAASLHAAASLGLSYKILASILICVGVARVRVIRRGARVRRLSCLVRPALRPRRATFHESTSVRATTLWRVCRFLRQGRRLCASRGPSGLARRDVLSVVGQGHRRQRGVFWWVAALVADLAAGELFL